MTDALFSLVTITGSAAPAGAWPAGHAHVTVTPGLAQRRRWTSQIDRAILDADRRVLLVTQGLGCLAAACWARLSPRDYVARIADAVFIDPPSPRTAPAGFAAPPVPLPFRSTIVSSDHGDASLPDMIAEWGSRIAPPVRRQMPRTPLMALVERLTQAVVDHDVERTLSLLRHDDQV